MEKIEVYKLTNGDLEENKERAEERQKEIDIRSKLLDMRLMFIIEVNEEKTTFNNFHTGKTTEVYSIIDEIKKDFDKIGYYLNATRVQHRDEYTNTITFAAYKER